MQTKICDEFQYCFPGSSFRIFRKRSDRVVPKPVLQLFCRDFLDASLVLDIGHVYLENRHTKFPFCIF